jgi:tryptophan synthase alpha chain
VRQLERDLVASEEHVHPEILQARRSGSGAAIRFSATEGEDRLYFARRRPNGDVLRFSVAAAQVREIERPYLWSARAAIVLACLALFLVGRLLSKRFSDPIADGPTIQHSSDVALKNGMSFEKVLALVRDIRRTSDIPILLMGYLNPFFRRGIKNAVTAARRSGVDGFIIPDVIPEVADEIRLSVRDAGLSLVFLAAPNTPPDRLRKIDALSDSFVYFVSVAGVTGGRKKLPEKIEKLLYNTRKYITLHPRLMGFGISGPLQVRRVRRYVDGVIVGSALIDIIRENPGKNIRDRKIASFITSMKDALRGK